MELSVIPQHVAIIMDGNGRWAQDKGLPRPMGHEAGARAVSRVVEAARELGIRYLTLYAFSQENWGRPPAEVSLLWKLLHRSLKNEEKRLINNEISLQTIGRLERLPDPVRETLKSIEESTSCGKKMTLTLALSYGARDEIIDATRKVAQQVATGELSPENISEKHLTNALYAPDLPDPDLMIRTSGEQRLSNFLLWQLAYTELYMTDTPWPEFGRAELIQALEAFAGRQRRYGKVSPPKEAIS